MAKLIETVQTVLSPFETVIGADKFPVVKHQLASLLGEVKLSTDEGRWKVSAKGIVTQGSKTKGVLPMNNPAAILYRFALALEELTEGGEFELTAVTLPVKCRDWIKNIQVNKPTTPKVETAKA